MENNKGSMCVT
nr:unnamed protein product [Callosobruchus analis]